jgi:peptide deformylase
MIFNNLPKALLLLCLIACNRVGDGFTPEELALINGADSIMRVLTIDNPADSAVLRTPSRDIPAETLTSADFKRLAELMLATVNHPSQDGVGIAGPQVGINRRVVAVQRYDKEPVECNGVVDHPFEVYPNIRIVWASDSLIPGPEGCLSVPNQRGVVMRSPEIVIEYASMTSAGEATMIKDTVKGFTAVIFQHEIDHLDGTLYIDRL